MTEPHNEQGVSESSNESKKSCNIKEHECIDCGACKYSECECNW